jgi:hypothetical protein
LPPPRLPHPRGDITHGPAYGENLEKRPGGGSLSRMRFSPGIATTAPAPRGDASHGPVSDDTPRMRLSPGIATTAPAPPGGGGGGQRPGGVGEVDIWEAKRRGRGGGGRHMGSGDTLLHGKGTKIFEDTVTCEDTVT